MAKVDIYTSTYCSFCTRAIQLLESKGIPYSNFDVNGNKKKELYMKTGQNTIPYVFIDGNFIGGCSELQELDALGKLDEMCGKK